MKTGYTVNDSKHTSLLEDGFIPVETASEVPVQEQLKREIVKGNLINVENKNNSKIERRK